MARVLIPTHLRSYTGSQDEVVASGDSVGAVLADVDARFPGLRFRIVDEQDRVRPHIKIFVGQDVAGGLEQRVGEDDELMIVAALSGG